ncbi:TolC family protein [Desulfobacterota bacterium M19]
MIDDKCRPWIITGAQVVLFILLLTFSCQAAPPAANSPDASAVINGVPRVLTMPQAVNMALKDNDQLLAGQQEVAASQAAIGMARSNLLPHINVKERYMRTDNPTYGFMAKLNQQRFTAQDFALPSLNSPDPINDFQTSIGLSMPLFAPRAYIGLDMSKIAHRAVRKDFQRREETIAMRVVTSYLQAKTARAYIKVARQGVKDAEEHLRLARARYKNNLGLYSDILRASTAVKNMQQIETTASKNYKVACRALGLLLGLTTPVTVADTDFPVPLRPIDQCQADAAHRQDVRAMELRCKNARQNLRLARASLLPVLGVSSSYQMNDHNKPFGSEGHSWMLGAGLKWNLFDGRRRSYEETKAMHQVQAAVKYLAGLKKAVAFQVFQAYETVNEAGKNVSLAEEALKSALEGQRLVNLRYENSLSPMVDLLDAQISLDQSRAHLVARQNDRQLAILNLSYESGMILKDLHAHSNFAGEKK